ncbi:MAG TPA: ABC transporter ATP-binding protein [Caldimonas sp.]|nr:ABC transporter ATP-binding protein [Caldimonas sp.]
MQPSIGSTVTIRNLDLAYSGHSVLKGLDWNLPRGQVVGLLGRNGAGKTSLLEAMLGLRDNATGQINLFDQPVARLDDTARERIGYVPQQSDLFEWLTPAQLLAYFRSFYSHWNEAKVETLLTRWSIDRHLPIGKLSGGQQQRLSIIRAMAHEPDLLILDEPVASLDPAGRRDFLQEIVAQVIDRDTTVVFSTHILSDLERVAFDVAFLSEGKIVLQAQLDELKDDVRSLAGPTLMVRQLIQEQGWQVLCESPSGSDRTRVLARREPEMEIRSTPGIDVERLTLEDLFLELTR